MSTSPIEVKLEVFDDDDSKVRIVPQIFGWEIYRVWRDENKEIIEIDISQNGKNIKRFKLQPDD